MAQFISDENQEVNSIKRGSNEIAHGPAIGGGVFFFINMGLLLLVGPSFSKLHRGLMGCVGSAISFPHLKGKTI